MPSKILDRHGYKYYDLVMALFVTVLICSNFIGAIKIWEVGGFKFRDRHRPDEKPDISV
jgi:hypothetical protein